MTLQMFLPLGKITLKLSLMEHIRKIVVTVLVAAFSSGLPAQAQHEMPDTGDIQHQLKIYGEVTEYLDEVFQEFSEGYMDADTALGKINLLKHEYDKITQPVPKEAEKLHQLVKNLLSQIENYFIYYKKANRENPGINLKVARAKFEASREAERLRFAYMP